MITAILDRIVLIENENFTKENNFKKFVYLDTEPNKIRGEPIDTEERDIKYEEYIQEIMVENILKSETKINDFKEE